MRITSWQPYALRFTYYEPYITPDLDLLPVRTCCFVTMSIYSTIGKPQLNHYKTGMLLHRTRTQRGPLHWR